MVFVDSGKSTTRTGWVKKSKLSILSEYVDKTEKIGGMWINMNIYRENWALSHINWKQSMKLLLGKHELAYVNMTP